MKNRAPVRTDESVRRWLSWNANPRRSLALGALGAALGLAVAGVGLFTAKGTAIRGVPPEDVAVVNQRPLLQSDYVALVEAQTGGPFLAAPIAKRRAILEDMIKEELFVQRGLELGEPSTDPDSRAALVAAVQQQVAVDATSEVPSEAQLRAYYAQNRDAYASMGVMTVRDLVAPPGPADERLAVATRAANDLKAGQSADSVVSRYGLKDSGKAEGEQLYFAAKLNMGVALYVAATGLLAGGVAGPILAADGPHVLFMVKNKTPRVRSFEEARPQIYSDYKQALTERLRNGEYRYLRAKADIQVAGHAR
jgi:parvulin-like peptidyl-prolyl isomerase